jgi:hypothetical protein
LKTSGEDLAELVDKTVRANTIAVEPTGCQWRRACAMLEMRRINGDAVECRQIESGETSELEDS